MTMTQYQEAINYIEEIPKFEKHNEIKDTIEEVKEENSIISDKEKNSENNR